MQFESCLERAKVLASTFLKTGLLLIINKQFSLLMFSTYFSYFIKQNLLTRTKLSEVTEILVNKLNNYICIPITKCTVMILRTQTDRSGQSLDPDQTVPEGAV